MRVVIEVQWFFLSKQLNLFLTAFSLLLVFKFFEINAHFLWCFFTISNNSISSSRFQGCLFMSGFKWLFHLSLHCFPVLGDSLKCRLSKLANLHHLFYLPSSLLFLIKSSKSISYSSVHGIYYNDNFNKSFHLFLHYSTVRRLSNNTTSSQILLGIFRILVPSLAQIFKTIQMRIYLSSSVQFFLNFGVHCWLKSICN